MPTKILSQMPSGVADAISPLFDQIPIDDAMTQLVVTNGGTGEQIELVESLIRRAAIGKRPPLCAGLWLYVDELDRSHEISQVISDQTGSFWHGIMHRREGDFSNSHYWFRNTAKHPAMAEIEGYDPHQFVDDVNAAHRGGSGKDALIELQRREWATLLVWCSCR